MGPNQCRVGQVASVAILAVSDTLAWASSFNAGAFATAITLVGGAVVGLIALAITTKARTQADATKLKTQVEADAARLRAQVEADAAKLKAQTDVDAAKLVAEAKAQAWAAQRTLEMKIQAEQDKLNEASLTKQLEYVRKSLHELRNQADRSNSLHIDETTRLTHQLDLAAQAQVELHDELQAARDEIRRLRDENMRILVELKQQQADQDRKIDKNSRTIEQIAAKEQGS